MNNGKIQLTQKGYDDLKNELSHLTNVDRVKNLQDIKDARAQGDLSENADYDAARDRQREIEKRIKEIEAILKKAEVISTSSSNLGKYITIEFLDTKETEEYQLVSSIESDPMEGKISNESPVGSSIMKAKVGDVFDIKIETAEYQIKIISIKDNK